MLRNLGVVRRCVSTCVPASAACPLLYYMSIVSHSIFPITPCFYVVLCIAMPNAGGNIILTDADFRILSLLRTHDYDDTVRVAVKQIYPFAAATKSMPDLAGSVSGSVSVAPVDAVAAAVPRAGGGCAIRALSRFSSTPTPNAKNSITTTRIGLFITALSQSLLAPMLMPMRMQPMLRSPLCAT